MKKIININLSGRVIPIEDSAYESLQRYIESLRRYFAAEEGRDEIINDIESRVAELMNDKIKKGAAAVTEADMEEIISSMGRVEDFIEADAADSASAAAGAGVYTQEGQKRFKGRLYRDMSDKILGGVCSGIANYTNVDPAIIRILFAIITLGGWGIGIFLYIIAWIVLPPKNLEGYVGKRFFRNPDDRIIGGVAGGLAAYFNKDAWMIRLIFAAPLILNILFGILNGMFFMWERDFFPNFFIGSFTGTFVLAYIILWIVLPVARSPYEKMEMRGEKVDVNRIRQNVQEGMGDIKTKAQAFGEEVKTSAQQLGQRMNTEFSTRGKAFATEAGQAVRPVASGIGYIIGVLFKAFFLFIAGVIAFALFTVVLVFTVGGMARPFNDFLLNGFWQNASLWGVLILFLAVPLIAIITWVVRRLMQVRTQNRYLGWIFSGLWMLGWVSLFIFIASMAKDWRRYNRTSEEIALTQPVNSRMLIKVDEPEIRYSGSFTWIDSDGEGWDITDDSLKLANVKFRFEKSSDSMYHVTIWKYSAGQNRNDALRRAEKIQYSAASIDSALILGSGYGISKEQKFRGQKVMVEIKVPVGKMIRFDESVENKLHPFNVRVRENHRWNSRDWDIDWDEDWYFDWKTSVDYVMTEDGKLVDKNNPVDQRNESGVYEYRPDATATDSARVRERDSLNRLLEEQRRKTEEENQRLRELEEKVNRERTGMKRKRISEEGIAQVKSPIFSLLM